MHFSSVELAIILIAQTTVFARLASFPIEAGGRCGCTVRGRRDLLLCRLLPTHPLQGAEKKGGRQRPSRLEGRGRRGPLGTAGRGRAQAAAAVHSSAAHQPRTWWFRKKRSSSQPSPSPGAAVGSSRVKTGSMKLLAWTTAHQGSLADGGDVCGAARRRPGSSRVGPGG